MRRALELTGGARPLLASAIRTALAWAMLGVLLIAAVYQVPADHEIAVGLNDAAYVHGFGDPVNRWGVIDTAFGTSETFRRSSGASALVFPQLGLPAEATLRWRSASAVPARIRVLQGGDVLADVRVGPDWSEQRLPITGGLGKPNDVVLRLLAEPADGVLVQRAALRTTGWPIVPYPAQLVYGGLVAGLGALVSRRRFGRWLLLGGLGLLFLLYRLSPAPFPLRGLLPGAALLLAIVSGVRALPRLERASIVAAAATAALVLAWLGWMLAQSGSHLVLSLPGVERDFPVFASRAAALLCPAGVERAVAPCVLRADGFYQLGYPFVLWAARLAAGNVFIAARWVAVGAGALVLLATWALAWRLYRPPGALLAVAVLALSPIFVQYTMSLGTDMPFAALWTAALAALLVPRRHTRWTAAAAGALCGLAFAVRHPGIVLLPFGIIALVVMVRQANREHRTQNTEHRPAEQASVGAKGLRPCLAGRTRASASKNQGTKEPRNQGTKEPRNQGTKEPRNQGTKEPRNQGTKQTRQTEPTNQSKNSWFRQSPLSRRTWNLELGTWNLVRRTRNPKLETRNLVQTTRNSKRLIPFLLAWFVAVSPQLIVNVADTGNPLYSRQAKNIWLAVYADIDYSRWNEAGDEVRLSDLVRADPARFFGNWGRNLKAFVATGGEDTSEFGRAIGFRLLGFPANLLAFAGLGCWLWRGGTRERLLVLAGTLYVVGIAVGFALPRFFVPVAPILALAAVAPLPVLAAACVRRWRRLSFAQWNAVLALTLLGCLAAGPRIGARYVLDRQDAAAAAIARDVQARLEPGSGVRFVLGPDDMLDDASAIAELAVVEPATIVVIDAGRPLPPALAGREPFATAGRYRAYEQP